MTSKEETKDSTTSSNRKPLTGKEEEDSCCICFEQMQPDQNLTFCKKGCGQNIHMNCAEHLVKHKLSTGSMPKCPLCWTSWGEDALNELRAETKVFNE